MISEQKIDDLYASLQRLREFVETIPESQVGTVPTCVEEYYDKSKEYALQKREEVVSVA